MIVRIQENCKSIVDCNLQEGWLLQLAGNISVTQKTAYNWWSSFCKETGLSITPKQASAERKAFAAEVGRICLKLRGLSNDDDLSNLDKLWLMEIVEKTGQARSTINNWWSSFCKETGLSITPKQASAERKAFAAEVGRLIASFAANCQKESFANGNLILDGNWVDDLAKNSNTPIKTVYNWWTAFCKETGLSITPKQASAERKAFAAWPPPARLTWVDTTVSAFPPS
ncbi:MAG: hypothetical protein P9F75_09225 [Candidatus Contendobacter sp.]|nr:hypothetical protein [Candidatus Contendobacter sp.]